MFLGGNGANLIKLNQRRGADSVGRGGAHSQAGLPGELKEEFQVPTNTLSLSSRKRRKEKEELSQSFVAGARQD